MEPFRGQNGTQMEHVPGRRCRREAGGRQAACVLFGVHASILAHSFAEGKGWGVWSEGCCGFRVLMRIYRPTPKELW